MADFRRLVPGLLSCKTYGDGRCGPADEMTQLRWQQRKWFERLAWSPHTPEAQALLPDYLRDEYDTTLER